MAMIHDVPEAGAAVAASRPDLVIVGDSHTAALHKAARARGWDARLVYLSGNFWHEGAIRWHRDQGLAAVRRPPVERQIRAAAARAGGTVFPPDVPVIASFGYHLGRLLPLLRRRGHTPDAADFDARPEAQFVSRAMTEAWLDHHRNLLRRILRAAARRSPLVVVAPPVVQDDPADAVLAGIVTGWLEADGVTVFDPRREEGFGPAPLPARLRTPDGVHGTEEYGAMVLDRLVARGLIAPGG
jgi:hypothetical protein